MRIPVLQQIPVDAGPFVTVSLDVSRDDESAGRRIELSWRDHRRALAESGVPDGLVEEIGERVEAPTGRPGSAGRLVVAGREAVLLDLVLPRRPVRDEVVAGPAPHLLPAFRALGDRLPYLLAEIDRTGADVTLVDEWGSESGQVVEGDHDVIHKVPGGGVAHRRIQARVEDSWARNAAEVASELERLVARHRPAVVLLDGDPIAVGEVLRAAAPPVGGIAVRLTSGQRAPGASTEARDADIVAVLVQRARAARASLLDRFATAEGRQGAAAQSLADVVEAARRAQIGELLLHDDPSSTDRLWIGEQPLQLGTSRDEVTALGAGDPRSTRADAALVWAVVHADAGVTVLDPDEQALRDGIGAVLRWSDASTPHDAVPSMPDHAR